MKRAVFLDRDNTIVQNDGDLGDPAQVRLIRGAAHAIGSLRQLGYRIVVVSNQGGVARGKYTERDVDAVHQRIAQLVHESSGGVIDRFYYCPFHPQGAVREYTREHSWRKPQPGMLLEAAKHLDLDLHESWMIGDHERDVEAGLAAGCQTILITREPGVTTKAHFQAASLAEAATIVAQNRFRTRPPAPSAPPASSVTEANKVAPSMGIGAIAAAATSAANSPTPAAVNPAAKRSRAEAEPPAVIVTEGARRSEVIVVQIPSEGRWTPTASEAPVRALDVEKCTAAAAEVEAPEAATKANGPREMRPDGPQESKAVREVAADFSPDRAGHEPSMATGRQDEIAQVPVEPMSASPAAQAFPRRPRTRTVRWERDAMEPAAMDEMPEDMADTYHMERLLTELLSEVRSWRLSQGEFTPLKMLAVLSVLGLVIVGALLAIYLEPQRAIAWIGVALLGQIAIVALLALDRAR